MKKHMLMLTVTIIMLVTGCAASPDDNTEYIHPDTIAPPEGGWTAESAADVIYIEDTKLTYPLTLRDLGNKFTYDISYISDKMLAQDNTINIKYLDKTAACAVIDESSIAALDIDDEIKILSFWGSDPSLYINGINGLSEKSSKEEIIDAMGNPDAEKEFDTGSSNMLYRDRETGECLMLFSFDVNDKLTYFSINLSGEVGWYE